MNAVPGRIGPLLTTGVALSVAAVVVANPVIAPRADLQIPAVQVKLSSTGDDLDMLNTDFLNAIGPAPAESSGNPFAVLRDLVASLAADATYLGRNVIVKAFFAGATAVTTPELTAASHPYVPLPPGPAGPVAGGPATWPVTIVWPTPAESGEQLLAIAALPADLVPAAAQVVITLVDDVYGLGDTAVTAAFAAGALLVTGGGQVVEAAVRGLVDGDVEAVLTNVLAAVGSGDVQRMIGDVIRDVVEEPATGPRSAAPAPIESPATGPRDNAGAGALPPPLPTPPPSIEPVGADRGQSRTSATQTSVVLPFPDAEDVVDVVDAEGVADVVDVEAEISLPGPAKKTFDTAVTARNPVWSGPLNGAVADVRKQTQGILKDAADAVRKAADRAARSVAGPTGD